MNKAVLQNASLKRYHDAVAKAPPPLAVIVGIYYVAITLYFLIIMQIAEHDYVYIMANERGA